MIQSRETILAIAAWLLVAACDSRLPTDVVRSTPPEVPSATSAASSPWSASFRIPSPAEAPDVVTHRTGIVIPGEHRWYRVRIEGAITLHSPAKYYPCSYETEPSDYWNWIDMCTRPLAGLTIYPDGMAPKSLHVFPVFGRVDVKPAFLWRRPEHVPMGFGDWVIATNPVREGLIVVSSPTELTVTRSPRIGGYGVSGAQTVTVEAYDPISVSADRRQVTSGDTVTFTIHSDLSSSRHRWFFVPEVTDSTADAPRHIYVGHCADKVRCRYAPATSGQMRGWAHLSGYGWWSFNAVSAIQVGDRSLRIVGVDLPLPDSSFTTQEGENEVLLRAEVADPAQGERLEWEVAGAPEDGVVDGWPTNPPAGVSTTLVITAEAPEGSLLNGTRRWKDIPHPGSLDQKRLAYRVRAYDADRPDTVWSDPIVIRQHERDVLRQEYIDFGKEFVPERTALGVFATPNFSSRELNFGDYAVFLSTPAQRNGLEGIRALAELALRAKGFPFRGLVLTSAYRNPTHHHVHAEATATESQHLYGNAADVRIRELGPPPEKMFDEFRHIAKDPLVSACYEPESVVRAANKAGELTHFHFDWRSSCPFGW